MRLVDLEIAGHHWRGMRCGCGESAEHLPGDLRQVGGLSPEGRRLHVSLEGHLGPSNGVWEPAPAVTAVVSAALADGMDPYARQAHLSLLRGVLSAAGEGDNGGTVPPGPVLSKRCFALAAEAKWLLYQEMMTYREPGHAGAAFEVLALVETDLARLDRL
ncbi:hypothetical protein ACGFRB_31580 [Streptomyces sp. NPDC048718]|uniref:hypothetical protein n=1 Tax=Streptomyces sp. NPDC048718 TaxID=3365587 RepID=UPI00372018AC